MRGTRGLAFGVALAIVATACGGGGGDEDSAVAAADQATTSTSEPDSESELATAPEPGDPATETDPGSDGSAPPEESPLSEFLGFGGTPEDQEARFLEQERQRQELVRECMADEGFEYIPVDYSQAGTLGLDVDEDEFVATYGYGISTFFDRDASSVAAYEQTFADPNGPVIEALSEEEQEAYYRALYGEAPALGAGESSDGDASVDFEPQGCEGEAFTATDDAFVVFEEFADEIDSIYRRIADDPRIVELQAAWTICMSAADHQFADETEIFADLERRMAPIFEAEAAFFDDVDPLAEEALAEQGDTSGPLPPLRPELSPELQDQLDEIQAYEIEVAVAARTCRIEGETVEREVQAEYEQAFIDENRERLEELRPPDD